MANRIVEINALLSKNNELLQSIETEFYKCIHKRSEIPIDVHVDAKTFLGNLESILDYTARDVYDDYCTPVKIDHKVTFPIVYSTTVKPEEYFINQVKKVFPGLNKEHNVLIDKFRSVQPFTNPINKWLEQLNQLINKHKHEGLKYQRKDVVLSYEFMVYQSPQSKGNPVRVNPGGIFDIPSGITTKIGDCLVTGPLKISTDVPPDSFDPKMKMKFKIWTDFTFETNGESVIPFLRKSLMGVERIVNNIHDKASPVNTHIFNEVQTQHYAIKDIWAIRDFYRNLNLQIMILSIKSESTATVVEIKLTWRDIDGKEIVEDFHKFVAPANLADKPDILNDLIQTKFIEPYKLQLEQIYCERMGI